jgi:hypothetical protein
VVQYQILPVTYASTAKYTVGRGTVHPFLQRVPVPFFHRFHWEERRDVLQLNAEEREIGTYQDEDYTVQ